MISLEEQKRIEGTFEDMLVGIGITNFESKTALKYQYFYFNGVFAAFRELPTFWSVCIIAGRSILKTRKEKNEQI